MKKVSNFSVERVEWLNQDNYILHLVSGSEIEKFESGMFAELKVDNHPDVFLRRPISILNVDYESKKLSFFIKIIGKGTQKLSELNPEEKISVIYPLGNTFTKTENKRVLIIGGGSGIAPFILLGKELKDKNNEIDFLFGARTENDILLTESYAAYGNVYVTTEDGSMGEKGLVTDHSLFHELEKYDRIYTCGPDPMMQAIAKIAHSKGIECEVSLENMMACGFGVCLCCVVATHDGNKCVCTEGPVFNIKDLQWPI